MVSRVGGIFKMLLREFFAASPPYFHLHTVSVYVPLCSLQ